MGSVRAARGMKMGEKVKETARQYASTSPHLSLPPRLGLLLSDLTDISDIDVALRKVLSEYLDLKLAALDARIAAFETKWGMSFETFSKRCAEGTLEEDAYAYEVEKDAWAWEEAVTLKQHYASITIPW